MENQVESKPFEVLGIDDDAQMRIVSELKPEDQQSKRTTFRLTKESSDNLKSWAREAGTTIKEQFELLVKLYELLKKENKDSDKDDMFDFENRKDNLDLSDRKTYVISKRSFDLINKESKEIQVSRDIFVEKLIRIYMALRGVKAKKLVESKENHPKALKIIEQFVQHVNTTENYLKEVLVDDDPVLYRFGFVEVIALNLISAIKSELESGSPIDPEDISQF